MYFHFRKKFADKISQVDQVEGDGYTGIYVTVSSSMDGAWKKEEKVRLYGADGTEEYMKNGAWRVYFTGRK